MKVSIPLLETLVPYLGTQYPPTHIPGFVHSAGSLSRPVQSCIFSAHDLPVARFMPKSTALLPAHPPAIAAAAVIGAENAAPPNPPMIIPGTVYFPGRTSL